MPSSQKLVLDPSLSPCHPICRSLEPQASLAGAGPSQQTPSPAYCTSRRPRQHPESWPVLRNRRCLSVSNCGHDVHPQVQPRPLGKGTEGTEQDRGGTEAVLGLRDPQSGENAVRSQACGSGSFRSGDSPYSTVGTGQQGSQGPITPQAQRWTQPSLVLGGGGPGGRSGQRPSEALQHASFKEGGEPFVLNRHVVLFS